MVLNAGGSYRPLIVELALSTPNTADRWRVGIHRARSMSDLGFAALKTAYAGQPHCSLSLLDEETENEPACKARTTI
jgi:hypothetical protein